MDIQNNMNSQSNISYLRIRPCDNDNEIYLNSRKKEGTSSFLIKDKLNFHEINRKGFQTISNNISHQSSMWIINDDNWEKFMKVDSRRVIYFYKGNISYYFLIYLKIFCKISDLLHNYLFLYMDPQKQKSFLLSLLFLIFL